MSKHILIVEDNILNLELAKDLLEIAGHKVIEAKSGREAIEILRSAVPDLIITDVQMPDLDGCELVKILKNQAQTAAIKVIAMTAYAMKGDKEKLIDCGFDGYISKPLNTREFVATINTYIQE